MTSANHRCAAPGCAIYVPRGLLCCRDHWNALPAAMKRRVNTAWQSWCHRRGSDRIDLWERYQAAVEEARTYLREREAVRG